MKTFTQILKETYSDKVLHEQEADYDEWNEMTRTELRAAINAAEEILEMMDEGVELERWQLSEIVTASKSLTDVYINMSADNEIE